MTQILLRHVMKLFAVVLPIGAALMFIVLGESACVGFIVGAILGMISGGGLVYLVGGLLDPNATRNKVVLFFLMFGKLALVGVGLWLALTVFKIDGLGIIIGIGAALVSLTVGANRGSTSPEGQKQMAEDEARIAAEMAAAGTSAEDLEDKGSESS